MARIKMKVDEKALANIANQVAKRAETVVNGVAEEMWGGDAMAVEAELVSRLESAGVAPNVANVHELAQKIAAKHPFE